MTTSPQDPLTSQDVYTFTINTLDTLPWERPGVMESRDLLRVLVFAAASRLSVHQACAQRERAPSAPTVLGPLSSPFRDLEALEGHLNALLAKLIPTGLGKRGRQVAMDWVALPYHGTGEEGHHDEGCRSKAQGGTPHFFTSATAYAVMRGRRSPLALCRVRAKQTMDHGVRTLLARVVTLGMRMKLGLLDRGFYSVRVMRDLITAEWPCIRPAVNRGNKPTPAGGPTGTSALAAMQHGQWTSYPLNSPPAGHVTLDLAVVCPNTRGHRGRHRRAALLSATWGVTHRPWSWMRATSRCRFGIESSSRQAPQARMRTSSRQPALRLLCVGVACVLRHVWVWGQAEVMAQPQRGARQLRPQALRFARVLLWLRMEGARHYRLLRNIPVYHDLYERAQAFGIVFNY